MTPPVLRPRTRRSLASAFLGCMALALTGLAPLRQEASTPQDSSESRTVQIQYLEIVTPEVDATCATLGRMHDVEFSKPDPGLGNARTANLKSGGRIGVRGPMRSDETPVVRTYILVDDIEAAIEVAKTEGAEIAMMPMEIPEQGTFAIYIQGGIEYGLWKL